LAASLTNEKSASGLETNTNPKNSEPFTAHNRANRDCKQNTTSI
jgi:hypothetical protein